MTSPRTPNNSSPPLIFPSSPPLPPSSIKHHQQQRNGGSTPNSPRPLPTPPPPPLSPAQFATTRGGGTSGGGNWSLVGSPRAGGMSGTATPTTTHSSRPGSTTTTRAPAPPADLNSLPLAPLPHHLLPFLLPSSPLTPHEKRTLFTTTYLRSASSGTSDTLEWLLSIPSDPSLSATANARRVRSLTEEGEEGQKVLSDEVPRKWVELEGRDEEGNTALGLCVALGHAEGVRVLVEGGVSVAAGDRAGWTPLHWAVQNNDIPIAAYLLNHRASPLASSLKGLTPRDLVKRGREGIAMREVLQSAYEAAMEREESTVIDVDGGGLARTESRMSFAFGVGGGTVVDWENVEGEKVEKERRRLERKKRMELGRLCVRVLGVDETLLKGVGKEDGDEDDTTDDESNAGVGGGPFSLSDEEDPTSIPFNWSTINLDEMLVFSFDDLSPLFDLIITNIKPVRRRSYRIVPANVIFLCARYAHYYVDKELLEELIVGAMEAIEAAIHHRPNDMINCAFWLSNSLLLLYYLRLEPNLSQATFEMQHHLADLINEIFVFVIRDAERRIDRILETAILDHEALPGFEDVEFEGEWSSNRFVKKLTGGRKAGGSGSAGGGGMAKSVSARSLFEATASPPRVNGSGGGGNGRGGDGLLGGGGGARGKDDGMDEGGEATPKHITQLLSSTLFILQLYEIPPSIVVQAFSQLFYWIACEVFNRLLTQRKYLCRSKALQIRLNVSALEDWSRSNRMPSKMVSVHFAPLNQLLQWLQCLSSESSIDGLIGTIQSLRALNPLQLRRAVREYRYEVEESRMDDECEQYLLHVQKQWERMRMQKTVDGLGGGGGGGVNGGGGAATPKGPEEVAAEDEKQGEVERMIDATFKDPSSFGSYTPPGGVEALGELLNSRYMLPFAVPSSPHLLLHFNTRDAFGPFASRSDALYAPTSSGGGSIRSSRASIVSLSVNGDDEEEKEPPKPWVPLLPDGFFEVLDTALGRAGGGGVGLGVGSDARETWFDWKEGEGEGEEGEGEETTQEESFDGETSLDVSGDGSALDLEALEEEEVGGMSVQETPKPGVGWAR